MAASKQKRTHRAPRTLEHKALALHKKLGGKMRTVPTRPMREKSDLALIYTPGVAAVSKYVAGNDARAAVYTQKGRTVAIVSDGSAVLGLGNIGPLGALPVMEGKAFLFKTLAGVDAVPLVIDVHTADDIVNVVKALAPGYGGINLEDIAAPICFEVEARLKHELAIPVMHDDQHGTAIVVLAGLINACKVVKKPLKKAHIAVIGAGAAGSAIAKLLVKYGVGDVVVTDSKGIIETTRKDLNTSKKELARMTNKGRRKGTTLDAVSGADVVVGVSGPGTLTEEHVRAMAAKPIVFAIANPIPEIMPNDALKAGAAVVATGRSDFPNQINNALVFPGIFRGALDRKVNAITDNMKVKAAQKLAALVARPTKHRIIPSVFDKRVVKAVASAMR